MRLAVGVLCLVGCGRIAFDPTGGDVGAIDARAVPALVTVSGLTYRYTSFDNDFAAFPSAPVIARDEAGTELARTTSSPQGDYRLDIPTGGMARRVVLSYERTGYFFTHVELDTALDRDITGAGTMLWTPGDAPIWDIGSINSIYSVPGVTRDNSRGTLNVAVRDRRGASIDGVTALLDPPPELLGYTQLGGLTLAATTLPYSQVLAFNAPAGPTTVTLSKAGYTFPSITVHVVPGEAATLAIVHSLE